MSSLRLINETEIASGVSSQLVNNVFSEDFDTYKIVASGILLSSTGGTNINLRLVNSVGVVITEDYVIANYNMKSNNTFTDTNRGTGKDQVDFYFGRAGAGGECASMSGMIFNPFDSSKFTMGFFENVYDNNNIAMEGTKGVFSYPFADSITGFQAFATSTMAAGTIRTFGLRRS
jgi:hypothetical protein